MKCVIEEPGTGADGQLWLDSDPDGRNIYIAYYHPSTGSHYLEFIPEQADYIWRHLKALTDAKFEEDKREGR